MEFENETSYKNGIVPYTYQIDFAYDVMGQKILERENEKRTTTYRIYDRFGDILSEKQASGFEIAYSYDDLHCLTSAAFLDRKIVYTHSPSTLLTATLYRVGNWISPDPAGFIDGPNLYAYVKNSPLIFVDPYGLFLTETKDFFSGMKYGILQGTTFGIHSYINGEFSSQTRYGDYGAYVCENASMLVPYVAARKVGIWGFNKVARVAWDVLKKSQVISKGFLPQRSISLRKIVHDVSRNQNSFLKKHANHLNNSSIANSAKTSSDKMRFPANPDQLLSHLPRDAKGHIYTSDVMRIRPEKHSLRDGEIFSSRHHGQHIMLKEK